MRCVSRGGSQPGAKGLCAWSYAERLGGPSAVQLEHARSTVAVLCCPDHAVSRWLSRSDQALPDAREQAASCGCQQ